MARKKKKSKSTSKILNVYIEDEIKESYLDYSMSVIVSRALPDFRDGLKPIQRRILYAMKRTGVTHDKPYVKAAKVVGNVMGQYSPHGDSSCYGAMVRMSQPWAVNEPLVDGHGNWGSIVGDSAAAMRYTEARMTEYAAETYFKEDVSFDPNNVMSKSMQLMKNYDESTYEPVVLNTSYPSILVHGASGIAVGMSCNIPPHNLSEVIDGSIALIKSPHMRDERLLNIIQGPDISDKRCGGFFLSNDKMKKGILTGRSGGGFALCANFHLEKYRQGKSLIVIDSIPYGMSLNSMINGIIKLYKDAKDNDIIKGISNIVDETDKAGVRFVVEVKRGVDPKPILRKLIATGKIVNSMSYINMVLENGAPRIMSVREIILKWYKYRTENLKKYFKAKETIAQKKLHELEGFVIIFPKIRKAIDLIAGSRTETEAIQKLTKTFKLSRNQAMFIMKTNIKRLVNRGDDVRLEIIRLKKDTAYYHSLCSDKKVLEKYIINELRYIKKKYGKGRQLRSAYERNVIMFKDNKGRGKFVEKANQLKPIDSSVEMSMWEYEKNKG